MSDLVVSDEIIGVCAVNATLKTEGVAGMAGGLSDVLSRNLLGKEQLSKGIHVSRNAEDTVEIDVSVNVYFGANVPAVAWDIQENVKKEVETMTELVVNAVNIRVQGVEMPVKQEEQSRTSI